MKRKRAAEAIGVDVDADKKEVDRAFRQLSKKHHPDANGGTSTSEMAELANHRDILISDAELRRQTTKTVEVEVEVKPNEKFCGTVEFEGRCANCRGRGLVVPEEPEDCRLCGGTGILLLNRRERAQCTLCMGTGAALTTDHRCERCEGKRVETVVAYAAFTVPSEVVRGEIVYKKDFGGRNGVGEIHFVSK